MVISSTDIKRDIIHSILDFSLNVDSHKKSGQYSLTQISEILALAIEINNLINLLDKDLSRIKTDPGFQKPDLEPSQLIKLKRVLDLTFKYKSDLNSIAIDIGENLSVTNRYLQYGIDYLLTNISSKDFKHVAQAAAQQEPQAQQQPRPRQQAARQAPRKPIGLTATLMFLIALGVAGMVVYNAFFDRPATRVTSLVKEYRSDRKLSSVSRPKQSSELRVYGTKSVLNIFDDLEGRFKIRHPRVDYEIKGGDSGLAIRDLVDGKISLAASSRIPTVSERKEALKSRRALADHKIALDSVVVFTHKANPLETLSLENLKKIYKTDDITWKEAVLGHKSTQKITRFSLSKQSGTYAFFNDRVMYSEPTSEQIIHIYTPAQMIDLVAANPNAIGFASLSALINRSDVKILKVSSIFNEKGAKPIRLGGDLNEELVRRGEYPLTRYLYVISAGNLTDSQAKFIDFLRGPEAQASLGRQGLVGVL